MMHRPFRLTLGLCCLAVLLVAAAPAMAQQTFDPGIDAWSTDPAGGTFVNLDLPADFFCSGSAPYFGPVILGGVPLASNPAGALNGADTVIERLDKVVLNSGGCGKTSVVVRALSLASASPIGIFCPASGTSTRWQVEACTCGCCGVQPITTVEICDDGTGCGCGRFKGDLKLDVCLKFRNVEDGTVLGPVQQTISLKIDSPYCEKNPGSVLPVKTAVMVDTNCDSQADLAVPGSSNFFPGATCGGPSCPPDVCHEGPDHPHCVNPVCDHKP